MKFFHFHKWSEWSDPFNSFLATYVKAQRRYCLWCNKVEVRKIKQPWNIWFDEQQLKGKGKS